MAMLEASMHSDGPLDAVLRTAGAVFGVRGGRLVALHYGSAAGELAACVHGVGVTDRSDLVMLLVQGAAPQLTELLAGLLGRRVATGEVLAGAGTWWCRTGAERALVLCEAAVAAPVRESLRSRLQRHAGLSARDCSREWAAIGLIGERSAGVLRALGVHDEATDPPPPSFADSIVEGADVDWLLVSEHSAFALVAAARAGVVWTAIERAGREFGIAHVGREAAARYALTERGRARRPAGARV